MDGSPWKTVLLYLFQWWIVIDKLICSLTAVLIAPQSIHLSPLFQKNWNQKSVINLPVTAESFHYVVKADTDLCHLCRRRCWLRWIHVCQHLSTVCTVMWRVNVPAGCSRPGSRRFTGCQFVRRQSTVEVVRSCLRWWRCTFDVGEQRRCGTVVKELRYLLQLAWLLLSASELTSSSGCQV